MTARHGPSPGPSPHMRLMWPLVFILKTWFHSWTLRYSIQCPKTGFQSNWLDMYCAHLLQPSSLDMWTHPFEAVMEAHVQKRTGLSSSCSFWCQHNLYISLSLGYLPWNYITAVRTWKWMVGIWFFPFFRALSLLVSGSRSVSVHGCPRWPAWKHQPFWSRKLLKYIVTSVSCSKT